MASRTLVIKTKMDNTEYTAQIKQLERELELLKKSADESSLAPEFRRSEREAQDLQAEIEKVTNRLTKLKQKQEDLNTSEAISGVSGKLDNINVGLTKTIKSVGRWGLALLSIRSIYGFISSSISTASQYNEQLATDLDYIKFSIAQALLPILQTCVNLVYKLLGAVGYLAKSLFGVNIFSKATQENFKGTNKQAKELQKTLAGFDEMNVLNSNSASGGSVGVDTTPTLNMTQATNQMESFFTNLKKRWEQVGKEISFAINNPKMFDEAFGNWGTFMLGITTLFGGLRDFIEGVIQAIVGIFQIAIGLIKGDTELLNKGIENTIKGTVKIIQGVVGVLIGIFQTQIGVLRGLFGSLKDFIQHDVLDFLSSKFGIFGTIIGTKFAVIATTIIGTFQGVLGGVSNILGGIVRIVKGDFIGGITQAFSGLKDILLAPIRALRDGINVLIDNINKIKVSIPDWVPVYGGKTWNMNLPRIPKLARGGIVNNPGHGVMMGNYIAGESGQEAVLPLNSQTLDQLGEMLSKHIVINATIENKMNGRTISRELTKISANNSFATNS